MESINEKFLESQRKEKITTGQYSLSLGKIKDFLGGITNLEHLGLFRLALSCGIRREDIVRVKQQDFNFDTLSITFYESKKKRTKIVYVDKDTATVLEMIKKGNKGETYMFTGRSEAKYGKGHLSGKQAYNLFQKYLSKAGLEKRPFHSLRATCIKLCQSKGWKAEQVARHIGDTIEVIQKHYATPSDDEMRELAKEKALI